jgi:UDPglucose--hexose-1-phosphate uridylyltransferase
MSPHDEYPGGEWRQDVVTGRWHVVAPHRSQRPLEMNGPAELREQRQGPVPPGCPFCPGNEAKLPAILEELPGPVPPGWRSRAVQNRYPAFLPEEDLDPTRMAVGWQEVLVETPDHLRDWPDLSDDESDAVLDLYLRRLALAHERPGHSAFLFRNRGRDSGSSQSHPHAQLVAVRGVPPAVRDREESQRRYRARTGTCVVCDLPQLEPEHEARTVWAGGGWTALVPWAPADPFHLRVLPDEHVSSLVSLDASARRDLAVLLRDLLAALRDSAGDPHYNLMLHDHGPAHDPALHAHVEIRTRFTRTAGFELMTGTEIAVSEPRQDADLLRRDVRARRSARVPS